MAALNKKIWVVDDDANLAKIYAETFREGGFEVEIFNDGQEAWDMFQKGKLPDLLFTGIIMPRMTGFQLIEKLQADEKLKSMPVVIFSHRGRPEDRLQARRSGVDDFVVQGTLPLVEIVRRVKLVLGLAGKTYQISLDPGRFDGEELIDFFIRQNQLPFRAEDRRKKFFLVLEPELEPGKFKVNLVVQD